jgi:hypothetical protein
MSEISENLVASIAQALNAAKIPCVLWGHYLLNVHGVPSIIGVSTPTQSKLQICGTNTLEVGRLCYSRQ